MSVRRVTINGLRIVQEATDRVLLQVLRQSIALGSAHNVEMPSRRVVCQAGGENQIVYAREPNGIARCDLTAARVPLIEPWKFNAE